MNNRSRTLLIILIAILAFTSWILTKPEPKKLPEAKQVNLAMQDPLFNALHSKAYSTVEHLVRNRPHVLKELHAQGGTYMNCAASSKDAKMMKLIIKLGGDPNRAASCGTTPIIMAVAQNDIAMVRILLQAGANPNVFLNDSSPLAKAKELQNKEMIRLLLKYNASEFGNTSSK